MSAPITHEEQFEGFDDMVAPGDQELEDHGDLASSIRNYVIGLGLAAGLTILSFWVASGPTILYGPGTLMALAALAIAQMGVHLAFFLHITTGSDNINNALALAFGVLIVGIVIAGSVWIMLHLNNNMMHDGMTNLSMLRWAVFATPVT
jgi:cytochrome o ubiquinol oxidase operon protein cyoD